MSSYRRSSSDKEWKAVKDIVKDRDNNSCRLCRCLNIKEFLILRKNAGSMLKTLDPAHIVSVSARPDLCYEPNDICLVNHYSHNLLDNYKDPIDGHNISKEEVTNWWIRIAKTNEEQYKYLLDNNILIEEN